MSRDDLRNVYEREERRMRVAMTEAFGEGWEDHLEMLPTVTGLAWLAKTARGLEMRDEIAKRIPK